MIAQNNKCKTITIGGTFDALHDGHKAYIRMAFERAEHVLIYLTSNKFSSSKKAYRVRPFVQRANNIKRFLSNELEIRVNRCTILKLKDEDQLKNDLSSMNIDEAIVAPEYKPLFDEINTKRESIKKTKLVVIVKERAFDPERNVEYSSTAMKSPECIFGRIPLATLNRIPKNEFERIRKLIMSSSKLKYAKNLSS